VQSLQILLLTQLGERVMRSDFGTELPRLVFAPGSTQYLRLLETAVQDAVTNWEPRVDVNQIVAEADSVDPFKVVVSISYTVRQTNTSTNLVFPYYLGMVDHTNDLNQGRPVSLLASGHSAAQIDIALVLSNPIPTTAAGQFLSLLFVLATPTADVPAEWSANAVADVPAPATLSWSYTSTANGATAAFPSGQVHDGTQGLRRSGIVRLPLPGDWQPEPQAAGAATTTYKVSLQIANAGFTFPPLLLSLAANVVLARHVWARTKTPSTSGWAPLPGNVITLAGGSSLAEYPPIENTVQLQIIERDGAPYPWELVPDLSLSGPSDRVFLLDRAHSEISFGDGLTGRLPVPQPVIASPVTVTYQAGGGIDGNVGSGLFWEAVSGTDAQPPPFTAVNLTPGDGGVESETLALAEARSRALLNERNRAVSQADYQNLVQTTPGVGFRRAYAAIGYHPDFPGMPVPGAVTVFVVPYAPRVEIDGAWASDAFVAAPQPDPGALQAARLWLSPPLPPPPPATGRLIGADVFVCGPVYRRVWLTLVIAVDAAPATALREAIITGLQNYLDPLVGGDGGNGWPFGDPLRPTALLRVAQNILGTAGDVQSVSVRLDGVTAADICTDVTIRPHELVTLEHVDLQARLRPPPAGGLR
jgi:predicted phage baseplate assembly protein